MTIVRWSPIRELEEMRRNLDKLFGEYVEPVTRQHHIQRVEQGTTVPNIDVYERDGDLVIKTDLPGVEKEQIDLTIDKEALTVKAEVKKEDEVKRENYFVHERHYGMFLRTVHLPQNIDSSKAKASFKDGVLEIVLPKKEEAKSTEIKVDIA